jgi:4-carboxymuconolactone decarboxylase
VLAVRTVEDATKEETMTSDQAAHARGMDVLAQLGWEDIPTLRAMDEEFYNVTVENCFGSVWARPGMSIRDRELITLAVLVALNRTDGMRPHLTHAHHVGLSERDIRELIYQVMYYAGWSVGPNAMRVYKDVLASADSKDA